jgi:SAM-dependent methyltransferase
VAAEAGTTFSYADWRTGIHGYKARLRDLMDRVQPHSVCDIGGGARPALGIDEVGARGVRYTLLDISRDELDKASDGYDKVCLDICGDLPPGLARQYDMVLTHMLAEHVPNPRAFHSNVFHLLRPGGTAARMMPTYYEPAFVANALLPAGLSTSLVRRAQPARDIGHRAGKFPAYYRWCRGPSRRHARRFEQLGFDVVHMTGYFGTGYMRRASKVQEIYDRIWVAPLVRHPIPLLTAYCWVVLRRPTTAERGGSLLQGEGA